MHPCRTPCRPGTENDPCPWSALLHSPYARTAAGPETHLWETLAGRAPVLVLARTFTSAVRAVEGLAVFRGDDRVKIVFALSESTAFNAGTRELLESLQAALVPWKLRHCVRPRLVLTASENVDLTGFTCPVAVLPHGIGFQKLVPDHRTGGRRLSGLVREESQSADNVHLLLSHPAQLAQLREARIPQALLDRARVVGDPARDRLVDARRLRHGYRARLGLHPGQRLLLLTSTWGPEGAIGSRPDLPGALLGSLPHDLYRVAAVLHPNIWFAHSPWSVRHMLADALDSGLLLIPPHAGWGAAMVAADCVVGDHGSVTLYGASLDLPVLLAAFGEESVPGTAAGALARSAVRLAAEDLRGQVESAIEDHTPDRHRAAADLAFGRPGQGGRALAELLYGFLDLLPPDEDGTARTLPYPVPDGSGTPPRAFEVHGRLEGQGEIALERFPAASRHTPAPRPGSVRHLSVLETEERHSLARSASVVCRDTDAHDTPEAWAEEVLELLPGALIAASPTGDGTLVTIRGRRPLLVRTSLPLDPVLASGAVYTLLRTVDRTEGTWKLHVGSLPRECSVEALPVTPPRTRPPESV
ncbi:hypothetical protein [Nocardiopsis sp. LOL_012]|uniref:hypothetical protein n=1 Tax=Nocardiopsis sp. LOL_012 TaxID=3345409 RepID=UPI003A84500B